MAVTVVNCYFWPANNTSPGCLDLVLRQEKMCVGVGRELFNIISK